MTSESEFRARLEKKLQEGIAQGLDQLSLGYADSFDNYRDRCGYLRALRQCLDLCAEVEKEMKK